MSRLRAGVIGLGMMGRNHVRVLQELDDVQLVGVADNLGDNKQVARSIPCYESVEALLDLGLNMCVVATPTDDHEYVGLRLAEAGVHTLVEKPLADDSNAAARLADAFAAKGVIGCVGHIERYNPALRALRARLEADELGAIFQIATRRQGPFPNRVRDVGVVMDLATHDVDLTAWVAGSPFASISARTAHKTARDHEDLVAATGVLGDGTITNHLVNWLTPTKERVTWVTGARGAYAADTLTADLVFYRNGEVAMEWEALSAFRGVSEGDMIRYAIPKQEPLVGELEAFRDAILGEPADIVTMHDGVEAVRVAEAMIRSANEGATVDVSRVGGLA